jgi:serine/threonine protein phosphatase 1
MPGLHFRDARAPEGMRLYAIGDVHGRLDLLAAMHGAIDAEIARERVTDWRIVHLGDYVDRGPDARGVLDFLIEKRERDPRIVCLGGNHERGLLDFLAMPSADCLFVRFGGVETARSYGVDLTAGSIETAHRALVAAIPSGHVQFLKTLPVSATFGDFFFCHAGVRPGMPLDRQEAHDLTWIRDEFLSHAGLYEKVIVHGHTPGRAADVRPNRVNLDSYACGTGRLSALAADGAVKRILETTVEAVSQRAATTP